MIAPPIRRLALFQQGLLKKQYFGTGLSGTQRAIEHLGYIQIDTLSVVERAHHHVLWSRVPYYEPTHLNQLINEKHIFEYWYHAASYLPMRDYRYALPNMIAIRQGKNRYYNDVNKQLMNEILARVSIDGPLKARDLDKSNKGKGKWWSYGPSKKALEKLFMQGDLMVCQRNGMEKVYDIAERCLPSAMDLSVPTLSEYAVYLFDTTLRAHSIFTLKQLLHLKTGKPIRKVMLKVLDERIEDGKVSVLAKEGEANLYMGRKLVEEDLEIDIRKVKILSPFDNAVIHRERLNQLFGFDYKIECYVPAAKRKFGYFCLPILFGDTFVARIDCKVHRCEKRLDVLSLHLEEGEFNRDQFAVELRKELQQFADFNQCSLIDQSISKIL